MSEKDERGERSRGTASGKRGQTDGLRRKRIEKERLTSSLDGGERFLEIDPDAVLRKSHSFLIEENSKLFSKRFDFITVRPFLLL